MLNKSPSPLVQITSIGGSGMFGMNCLLLETQSARILIDCGVMFPSDEDLGVDYITPDFTIIEHDPPQCLLLTHAHEDHIGAIPFMLQTIQKYGFSRKLPIYGTDITIGFVKRRLAEYDLIGSVNFNVIKPGMTFIVEDCSVECIDVCHSIPGSLAFSIGTPAGVIVHSGDWRIDNAPMTGSKTNLARFESLGDDGVRVLMADSTNVEVSEFLRSESDVFSELQRCFKTLDKRILITLFASNIGRLQSILYAANAAKRKVAICGRSLNANLAMAHEMGYLSIPNNLEFVKEEQVENAGDNLVIVVSGSQGERSSTLYRIARDLHAHIKLKKDDVLIYSARQIPGNERRVDRIINEFYKVGANVMTSADACFHSSGHGNQRELELLLELLEPELFVPIHGDYRRLTLHEELAKNARTQTPTQTIEEGYALLLYPRHHEVVQVFEPCRRYVTGKCLNGINREIAKEKKNLGHQGLLFVSGILNPKDELISPLTIKAIGITSEPGWLDELNDEILRTIHSSVGHGDIQEIVRHKAAKYVKNKIARTPEIISHFPVINV